MRLQRYLAQCGVASRRKCEEIIASGRVTVNGEQIIQMGFEVDEEKDSVTVDGKTVTPVMLHTY
ncbi:S4 domain-containing protein, partial [Luoshenia tenuis]|uniref:S4 domain-containing protein n=2 Tax=Clostridia TaxID=186801 RepID=UPI003D8E471F